MRRCYPDSVHKTYVRTEVYPCPAAQLLVLRDYFQWPQSQRNLRWEANRTFVCVVAAIVSGETVNEIYSRVKDVIRSHSGPVIWIPARHPLWVCLYDISLVLVRRRFVSLKTKCILTEYEYLADRQRSVVHVESRHIVARADILNNNQRVT